MGIEEVFPLSHQGIEMAIDLKSVPVTENHELPASPAAPAIERVMGDIAQDCRQQPQQYLDEVVVPFGGE